MFRSAAEISPKATTSHILYVFHVAFHPFDNMLNQSFSIRTQIRLLQMKVYPVHTY
jgi:hypothetical protein